MLRLDFLREMVTVALDLRDFLRKRLESRQWVAYLHLKEYVKICLDNKRPGKRARRYFSLDNFGS
jgi:hypothetical protein